MTRARRMVRVLKGLILAGVVGGLALILVQRLPGGRSPAVAYFEMARPLPDRLTVVAGGEGMQAGQVLSVTPREGLEALRVDRLKPETFDPIGLPVPLELGSVLEPVRAWTLTPVGRGAAEPGSSGQQLVIPLGGASSPQSGASSPPSGPSERVRVRLASGDTLLGLAQEGALLFSVPRSVLELPDAGAWMSPRFWVRETQGAEQPWLELQASFPPGQACVRLLHGAGPSAGTTGTVLLNIQDLAGGDEERLLLSPEPQTGDRVACLPWADPSLSRPVPADRVWQVNRPERLGSFYLARAEATQLRLCPTPETNGLPAQLVLSTRARGCRGAAPTGAEGDGLAIPLEEALEVRFSAARVRVSVLTPLAEPLQEVRLALLPEVDALLRLPDADSSSQDSEGEALLEAALGRPGTVVRYAERFGLRRPVLQLIPGVAGEGAPVALGRAGHLPAGMLLQADSAYAEDVAPLWALLTRPPEGRTFPKSRAEALVAAAGDAGRALGSLTRTVERLDHALESFWAQEARAPSQGIRMRIQESLAQVLDESARAARSLPPLLASLQAIAEGIPPSAGQELARSLVLAGESLRRLDPLLRALEAREVGELANAPLVARQGAELLGGLNATLRQLGPVLTQAETLEGLAVQGLGRIDLQVLGEELTRLNTQTLRLMKELERTSVKLNQTWPLRTKGDPAELPEGGRRPALGPEGP